LSQESAKAYGHRFAAFIDYIFPVESSGLLAHYNQTASTPQAMADQRGFLWHFCGKIASFAAAALLAYSHEQNPRTAQHRQRY
jgi:hypothetical protein